jgi:2-haloacid dehalogenase
MLDPAAFEAVTFDCYGTLIDWEAGILQAVRPVLEAHGVRPGDDELLSVYAELEAGLEAAASAERGSFMRYRSVLSGVMRGIASRYGVEIADREADRLPASLARWPAFPDTAPALRALKSRYRLAVLSNIDRDLFEDTAPKLGVELDELVTADFCRSYKPDPRHFRVGLAMLGLPASRVLHVAESLVHDIAPARAMGFTVVWINRRGSRGPGASGGPGVGGSGGGGGVTPHAEFASLSALVGALGL